MIDQIVEFQAGEVLNFSDILTSCMTSRLPSSCLSLLTLSSVLGFFYLLNNYTRTELSNMALVALEYEVFGKVQGVFFRKYTNEKAKSLGLRGWVKNTRYAQTCLVIFYSNLFPLRDGTVTGELEGEQARVTEMRSWLETKGSPQSRIDRAEFRNIRQINNFSFEHFKIIR